MSSPVSDTTSPSTTPLPSSILFTIPEETELRTEDAKLKDVGAQPQDIPDNPSSTGLKPLQEQLQETTELRTQLGALQDEVNQSKEFIQAVLDLRQWESQKAAESIDHLLSDRGHSRAEVIALTTRLNLLEERIIGLFIESSAPPQENVLRERLQHLITTSPRLFSRFSEDKDACESLKQARKQYGPDAELLLLREQLEVQKAENGYLKAEMDARAEEKKDEKFRTEVLEAVRQERVKDGFVVQSLRQENLELRKLLGEKTVLKW